MDSRGPGHSPERGRPTVQPPSRPRTMRGWHSAVGQRGWPLRCRIRPYWIKRCRCAAPGPALPAPGSALGGPPGAPAPSQPHWALDQKRVYPAHRPGAACKPSSSHPIVPGAAAASRVPLRASLRDRHPPTLEQIWPGQRPDSPPYAADLGQGVCKRPTTYCAPNNSILMSLLSLKT